MLVRLAFLVLCAAALTSCWDTCGGDPALSGQECWVCTWADGWDTGEIRTARCRERPPDGTCDARGRCVVDEPLRCY